MHGVYKCPISFEQAVPVLNILEMQRLIHRFKYQGVSYLSRTLGS